jgi:hypothetical protein
MASWFETREDALLTMRIWDLIPRSIATGSRECAPDDRLRDASRRMTPPNFRASENAAVKAITSEVKCRAGTHRLLTAAAPNARH